MVYVFYINKEHHDEARYIGNYDNGPAALEAICDDSETYCRKVRDYMAIQGTLLTLVFQA